jgi:mannosyltransferase OCH1-like enzyme
MPNAPTLLADRLTTPTICRHVIPKLLHQTAKTAELPEECRPLVDKLKALHPDWTYKLWTDADNLELVRSRRPEFLDVYQKLPKNIMRADVIRYVLMSTHGGVYLDTDYEFLKPFDLNDHDIVLPWESIDAEGKPFRVANAIFASVPGHPFWTMLLDDLTANPPLSPEIDVIEATGPGFVTRMYHRARAAGMQIHTPDRDLFAPEPPRLNRDYEAIVKRGTSYGIHHCFGSWRAFDLKHSMKATVWRVLRTFV